MMAQHHEKIPGDVAKFNCNSDGVGGDDLLDALRILIFSNADRGMKVCMPFMVGNYQPIAIELGV